MKSPRKVLGVLSIVMTLFISAVAMAAPAKLHTMVGEVQKIDAVAHTVTVKGMVGKKEKEVIFHLAPEASVTRNDQKVMLGDLKVGDRIIVRYASTKKTLTAQSIALENKAAKPAPSNSQ